MAGVLVAGAVLSAVFNVLIQKLASKEVVQFFKQRKLDREVLEKCKIRMNTVSGLLEDAEDKQITNRAVGKWLDDLKDVAYEAEDLLDEIAYQALEQQEIEAGPKTCSDQVRNFFSSLNPCKRGMGELQPRLNEICGRLDNLLEQNNLQLHLEKRDGKKSSLLSSEERLTTSLVDESSIYGRDDDKEAIVMSLLTDDERLGVIPIVGLGGVGKTTLAQFAYKDNRVRERFYKQAWICVSEDFDVLKLTKNILEVINPPKSASNSLERLQLDLEETVRGKRILLVLDDVWYDYLDKWEKLLLPLKSAAPGSKVLVTTRMESVASVKSTVQSHRLKELCEDDCWMLFAKYALNGQDSDADKNLKEVGRNIVKKCDGLPLAAKTIGSLLRSERRIEKWEDLLGSNIWDSKFGNIIPALRLSYHYLPSHLKQCFTYCAMFRKDYKFRKQDLILLWMAEGFIELENTGKDYFEDLLSRCFFQKYESWEEDVFVMHDLINDLAKSIAKEFCYSKIDDTSSCQLTERTRHLYYRGNARNALKEPESFSKAKFLRTLICSFEMHNDEAVVNQAVKLLSTLGRLRVLHLSAYPYYFAGHKKEWENVRDLVISAKHLRYMRLQNLPVVKLPNSMSNSRLQTLIIVTCQNLVGLSNFIGDLKDLRYLALVETSIERLPDSICDLHCLQHLSLRACRQLTSLPDSIGGMKDLRHLDLGETSIKRLPYSICGLHCLQYLSLSGCEKLTSLPDSIGGMKQLTHLYLAQTSIERLPDSVCGMYSLQHLSLQFCRRLVELPAKMMDLVSLCHLHIKDTSLKSMPPQMGKLVNLQTLTDFIVGEEGRGSSIAELGELGNLQGELAIHSLENVGDVQDALEANLKGKSHLVTLEYHWAGDDSNAGTVDGHLLQHLQPNVNVKEITISEYRGTIFPKWVGDSCFYNIVELSLRNCKYCTCLPPLGQLNSLECLSIKGFDSIVSVGTEFYGDSKSIQPFRSLKRLTFTRMPRWQEWRSCTGNEIEREDDSCTVFPLLEYISIDDCPELEVNFTQGIFASTLGNLSIGRGNKKISNSVGWDLRKCSSLSNLSLESVEDIESFPGKILLSSALESISITGLPNLKSLDYQGLQHLASLQELLIRQCPNLGCIPDGALPESLKFLFIKDCPLLEKRCQREHGEDWPKISRIQTIWINNLLI